uniref:Uncharacterized protein n=1 Tax=Gasterosteus aculeatus aculeatus TaxID=481459 RepID=A0AAQ4P1M5_GASAC
MSVALVRDEGVTVVTVATDSKSMLPPLCRILKTLCCSGSTGLMERDVTAALGTMQVMVGLFNIGLGPGRPYMQPDSLTFTGAAYWLGGVVMSQCSVNISGCYVGFAVLVNIVGSISAVVGIVQSSVDLAAAPAAGMCDGYTAELHNDNCIYVAQYFQVSAPSCFRLTSFFFISCACQRLLTGLDVTLIVLAVLHLCVSISFAVLGIKALVNRETEEVDKDDEDQHLMKEALLTNPAA